MTQAVFIGGRGLACALGDDLDTAVARLAAGAPEIRHVAAHPGATTEETWPYFAIPDASDDWYVRAERLVRRTVEACGTDIDREAPLYLASSSLNVGALESGAPYLPDCQSFVEAVAGWLDWRGDVIWVSTACTSALNALLSAQRRVAHGAIDSALVLGLELANRFSIAGFGAMQLLDPAGARPLAADRGGLVLGEAVAALEVTHRPGRWRLRGGANVVDGSDPAGASPAAVAAVLEEALCSAGVSVQDIDLVKLQAAGSPHNDAAEIAGLRAAWQAGGAAPALPALLSLKPHLGHTLGAAAAAEIALLTAALERNAWPAAPAATPDPQLAVALATQRPARLRHLVTSILGFGGGHACAVLEDLQGATGAGGAR